jgi:hypothetical protein
MNFLSKNVVMHFHLVIALGGGEAMGWAWRSADIYLTNLVSSCAILLVFIPMSLYCLHKKNYTASFMFALSPIIISLIDSLLGTLLYHYAKF